jgi:hypothetical protein
MDCPHFSNPAFAAAQEWLFATDKDQGHRNPDARPGFMKEVNIASDGTFASWFIRDGQFFFA